VAISLSERHFATTQVTSWTGFLETVSRLSDREDWIFRGQRCSKWGLESKLERVLGSWHIAQSRALDIEEALVREFRRRYRGADSGAVLENTSYCMSVMQHYSAPTRLLDWTYSPHVAAHFAVENASMAGAVWCLRAAWCEQAAALKIGRELIANRDRDRDEESFLRLYMPNRLPRRRRPKRFAFTENSTQLNRRLAVQQGLFLCPGDVGTSFQSNLKAMDGWDDGGNILKIELALTHTTLLDFALSLLRMNVTQASLFPGIDGLGRSLADRVPLLARISRKR
jgi:hypothetical protein